MATGCGTHVAGLGLRRVCVSSLGWTPEFATGIGLANGKREAETDMEKQRERRKGYTQTEERDMTSNNQPAS